MSFDFDEWKKLYETDPEAFEAKRKKFLEAEIAKAPERIQERLKRQQWQIDNERRRYKHPLVSAEYMFNKMWNKVYDEGGLLDALEGLTGNSSLPNPEVNSKKDNVLEFNKKKVKL